MIGKRAAAMLLVLSLSAGAAAGADSRSDSQSPGETFRRFPRVFTKTLLSPFHWGKNDVFPFAAVLGSGLILGFLDQGIRDRVQDGRTHTSDDLFDVVTRFGDGAYLAGFAAGLFAVGAVSGKDGLQTTALLSLESYMASSVFTSVLKFVPGRAQPRMEEGSRRFHPFSGRAGYTSLPSGHSSAVWSVATTIANRTDSVAIDVVCYGLAALTSFSRIHEDKHWASDVLIGSAIGYFTAKKVCALNRNPDAPKLAASFGLTGRRQSVTLSFSF